MIFRGGSGSGINLSNIRGSMEHAAEGRHRQRPGQLHARRRRLGGDDQVRRQDAAGGEDGRPRRRPPGHRALHLVQGRRGEEGRGAARRRLRHVDRRRGLHLDPVPERQQLGAGHRRVHGGGRGRRGLGPDRAHRRLDDENARRARADEPDRRRRLALRRSRRPVRHDHQPLAHLPGVGPDQRLQPLQRVHARRRLGLQPGLAQPDEIPPRGRQLRRRGLRARGRHRLPRPGDRRRLLQLPDRGDHRQRQRLPPARPRLRQPRRPADVGRPALRLRRGPQRRRRDHGADDRPRLPPVGADRRRRDRALRRVREEPRAPTTASCGCTATPPTTSTRPGSRATCSRPRSAPGTKRSSSARSTATATRRRRCWRRPGRSAS